MARPKKEGKAVSLLLEIELFEQLEKYCEKTYLSKTAAIEKALKKLFEEENTSEKKG